VVRKHTPGLKLAVVLVFLSAASASAFWTATSSFTARAVVPDPSPLSFGPGTPTARLFPGGDADVTIVADNANGYFLRIPSLHQATGEGPPFAVDSAHSGCDVSALSFVTQDNAGAGWSVPPKVAATDGTLTIEMPGAMHMQAAAGNACQGASFTVRLTVGP
jgi:hypothetical protein